MSNEEFEEYLVSIGGLLNGYYPDRDPIITNICECGDGWLGLIKNLIQELIDAGWDKQICQIKEKFGGLRFYTNYLPENGYQIIQKYEELSYQTCETCGSTDDVITLTNGWIKVVCNRCLNK